MIGPGSATDAPDDDAAYFDHVWRSPLREPLCHRGLARLAIGLLLTAWIVGCAAPVQSSPTPPPPALPKPPPPPQPLTILPPAIVLEPPDRPPTSTPEPAPANLPPEEMTIFLPGPGSQVPSPFQISGRGGPSWGQRVNFRLYGESGQLLSEGLTYLLANPGRPGG